MSDAEHNSRGGPVLPDDYFRRPSPSRQWNYLQGGNEHFALDRAAGDAMADAYPDMFYLARQCRLMLMRAVRLVAGQGVRQFLDLGCGLPAPSDLCNTHDIAQDVHPDARVVYVDDDRVVFAHARALLTPRTADGACAYLEADVRDTELVLGEAAETLDFARPVALVMFGILGSVPYAEALDLLRAYLAAVPSGSFLLLQDGVVLTEARLESVRRRTETGIGYYEARAPEQLANYFEGLEMLEPGLVSVTRWRPEWPEGQTARPVESYGAVARKP